VIRTDDYQFLSTLLQTNSGLSLGERKEYLLESRLPAVVRAYGLQSIEELIILLRVKPHAELVKAVCDAMTTSETLFFRDGTPFTILRNTILPTVAQRCRSANRPLRIWSAAAATGQEAYSLAMLVSEMDATLYGVNIEILGTDYAPMHLNRARRGEYTPIETQRGLPAHLLDKYFTPIDSGYKVKETIRRKVAFREFNLLDSFESLGLFDIILCRNVLIYFDVASKKDVMERLATALVPGGYVLLGGTETSYGITDRLIRVPELSASIYMRREDVPGLERSLYPPAAVTRR
jgi:chemotaxis protein methyltransferase CheR